MSALLYIEVYKLTRSLSFYLALFLEIAVMLVVSATTNGAERLDSQVYFMAFVFLVSTILTVGTIVCAEYDRHSLKELLLSGRSRTGVFFAKIIATMLSCVVLFLAYAIILILTSLHEINEVGWWLIANQFIALVQHMFILFNLAIMLRSFSALGVSSVAFILCYREFSRLDTATPIGSVLHQTFIAQFASTDGTVEIAAACIIAAIISSVIGMLLFNSQEIA